MAETVTESIDMLFLELSQFTKARTRRELALERKLRAAKDLLRQFGPPTKKGRLTVKQFCDSVDILCENLK